VPTAGLTRAAPNRFRTPKLPAYNKQLQPALPNDDKTKSKDAPSPARRQDPERQGQVPDKTPSTDSKVQDKRHPTSEDLHAAGEKAVYVACAFKAIHDNDFGERAHAANLHRSNAVLTDGLSFGYRFPRRRKKREGRLAIP